jgi:hypothetical protein
MGRRDPRRNGDAEEHHPNRDRGARDPVSYRPLFPRFPLFGHLDVRLSSF